MIEFLLFIIALPIILSIIAWIFWAGTAIVVYLGIFILKMLEKITVDKTIRSDQYHYTMSFHENYDLIGLDFYHSLVLNMVNVTKVERDEIMNDIQKSPLYYHFNGSKDLLRDTWDEIWKTSIS
jgi:hypothetical protein